MLTIRLVRTGKRNKASFRLVLIKKTAPPKSGKFLELLGSYDPHQKEINLKADRIKYWLSQGIQTSDTVHNMLVKEGVIKGSKIKKNFKIKKQQEKTEPAEAKPVAKEAEVAEEESKPESDKQVKKEQESKDGSKKEKPESKEKPADQKPDKQDKPEGKKEAVDLDPVA